MLVSLAILVIVAGTVITGMIRMTWSQNTVMNRTQVHSGVRNATELMQQEVGQAGKVSLPGALTIPAITAVGSQAVAPSSMTGLFLGEQLLVDPGPNQEFVYLTNVASSTITATFGSTHALATGSTGVPVVLMGGFASGVIPPSGGFVFRGGDTAKTTMDSTNNYGSTGSVLKLYGDLNGDGTMYYVVYKCDQAAGTLYRYYSSDVTSATTMTTGTATLLLDNISPNPNNAPCFTYSTKSLYVSVNGGSATVQQTFVINVAVTLTVQTQNKDLQTNTTQTETKALLNIAPRNVFEAWEAGSLPGGYIGIQPMPPNVMNSLAALYH